MNAILACLLIVTANPEEFTNEQAWRLLQRNGIKPEIAINGPEDKILPQIKEHAKFLARCLSSARSAPIGPFEKPERGDVGALGRDRERTDLTDRNNPRFLFPSRLVKANIVKKLELSSKLANASVVDWESGDRAAAVGKLEKANISDFTVGSALNGGFLDHVKREIERLDDGFIGDSVSRLKIDRLSPGDAGRIKSNIEHRFFQKLGPDRFLMQCGRSDESLLVAVFGEPVGDLTAGDPWSTRNRIFYVSGELEYEGTDGQKHTVKVIKPFQFPGRPVPAKVP